LPGGSVVLLQGDLGLGKTRLAKGIAMGLGLDPDDVLSPTFTLVHPHAPAPGRPGFVHVDLYRIAGPSELDELGLTELPGPDAVCAVEWPERLGARAAPGAVRVVIEDLGDTRRRFRVTWPEGPPPGRVI
jgi:tRNA threonylcarbamoyladenosine biosynthesis protein TsaE